MEILQELNPWQLKKTFRPDAEIKRDVFSKLKKALRKKEISVLIGARQVGKTTLIMSQIDYLLNEKRVSPDCIYYVNFDYAELRNIGNAISFLKQFKLPEDKKTYFFIDEVQRLENPGLFLKQLYDLSLPIKIVVSGSSALEIKSKIKESLSGRKILFEISPLSFEEFTNYKTPNFIPDKNLFDEYITFGGYPAVVKEKSIKGKIGVIREIVNSYFQKDVTDFLKIKSPEKYNDLIKIMASQIGSLVNVNELSATVKTENTTLENYLYYMKETYLLNFIRPYHKNIRKELTKQRKVYFTDFGIRNYFLNNFSDIHLHADYGFLAENFIYLKLRRENESEVYFWRTQNKTEIDFVTIKNGKMTLFEAKARPEERVKTVKSFESFEKEYPVAAKNVFCFTDKKIKKNGVNFLNFF